MIGLKRRFGVQDRSITIGKIHLRSLISKIIKFTVGSDSDNTKLKK